jgi:asparagine synthase (glutamine-hydrolysing)
MCGIAGVFGETRNRNWMQEQFQLLARRGPDSQAQISAGPQCQLIACRLAMTDPNPRSNQPFEDSFSQNSIVFNGEIYNYLDLKKKLLLDYPNEIFRTESDTEVLLRWLDKFGVDGISNLQGMYSFAYYQKSANTLTLSRDTLGKKPLYWMMHEMSLYWSSSLESFSELSEGSISADAQMQYFALGYLLDPTSIFHDVSAILPGEVVVFGMAEKGIVQLSLKKKSPVVSSSSSLRTTIESAVQRRIHGHDKVAISLSGGVDSSIISFHLQDLGMNATAFSSHWGDSDKSKYNQDAIYASKIADRLGMNHVQVEMPRANQIEEFLTKFLEAMQEPNANPTGISLYALYKEISRYGFRLVLTGDGSDEIFAGYQRYTLLENGTELLKCNSRVLRRNLINYNGKVGRALSRFSLSFIDQDLPETWFYWHGVFSRNELKSLYSNANEIDRFEGAILRRVSQLCQTNSLDDSVSKLMARDHAIWLDMESNRKLDRISMHFSIEARSPFQDERVIAIAANERKNIITNSVTKKLLWDSYPELEKLGVRKDKEGFISPVGHWLRHNQKLVEDSLKFLSAQKHFRPNTLLSYQTAPFGKDFRKIKQLWHLVVWAKWIQGRQSRVSW